MLSSGYGFKNTGTAKPFAKNWRQSCKRTITVVAQKSWQRRARMSGPGKAIAPLALRICFSDNLIQRRSDSHFEP